MEDQTSIEVYINQCVEAVAADELAAEEKRQHDQAEEKAQIRAAWLNFMATASLVIPEMLRPYIDGHTGDEDYYPSDDGLYILLPGCSTLLVKFNQQDWGIYCYKVKTYVKSLDWDRSREYSVGLDRWIQFDLDQLDRAIAHAVKAEQQRIELTQQAERENQAHAEFRARRALEDAQHEQAKTETKAEAERQRAREEEECNKVLTLITGDPIALALVKVLIAITHEQHNWRDRIESLEAGAESTVEYYERKLREERSRTETARRDMCNEQSRSADLEDAISAMKKETRR